MKLLSAVTLLLTVAAAPAFSADYPDQGVLASLDRIQSLLYNEEYEQARWSADSLIRINPHDPLPLLAWAGALISEMKEEEANLYPDLLVAILDKTDSIAEPFILSPAGPRQAWGYLAKGHAWAYRSLWEARFGSTAQAYRYGKRAKGLYQQGLKCDSSLYDLYAAMGEYNYWKSSKAGLLRSLGLIENERGIGLKQMRLAADSSVFSQASARRGLMWVYLDMGVFDSTIFIAHELLEHYPGGRSFNWAIARAYYEREDYPRAIEALTIMRQRMLSRPGNYHKLISVDRMLVESFRALDMPDEAHEAANKYLDYRSLIPKQIKREQRDDLRFLKKHSWT